MKTINTLNFIKTANSLRFFKESKHNYLFSCFRYYHFYAKSKKTRDLIYKLDLESKIYKRLQEIPCPKKEDISISFPSGFDICFNNLEQFHKLLYEFKLGISSRDNKQKANLNKLLFATNEPHPLLGNPGIYLIKNKINKMTYVGKASSFRRRLYQYCYTPYLQTNAASSNIYRAILKFGHANFSFSIVEICDLDSLDSREKHYIKFFKPQYNIRKPYGELSKQDYALTLQNGLLKTPCPNLEDLIITKPKGSLVCFNNMEQIQRLLYERYTSSRDKAKSDFIDNILLEEGKLSPFLDYFGIYLIQNKVNKNKYIGRASPLEDKLLADILLQFCYIPYLQNNASSSKLHRDMLKFGLSNFSLSVLYICNEKIHEGLLYDTEQSFINKLMPQYNIRKDD